MTLIEFLELLRRRVGMLIAFAVLGGALAAAWALTLPPLYKASATIYVLTDSGAEQTLTQSDLNIGSMITKDTVQIIESTRVRNEVKEKLGLDSLSDYKMEAAAGDNSRVIVINVESTDQERVADVANAYVEATSRTAEEVLGVESVNVVDEASRPSRPSGPPRVRYIAIGVGASLVLGVLIALLRDLVDTRVRSSKQAEEIVGSVTLGRFPKIERN